MMESLTRGARVSQVASSFRYGYAMAVEKKVTRSAATSADLDTIWRQSHQAAARLNPRLRVLVEKIILLRSQF